MIGINLVKAVWLNLLAVATLGGGIVLFFVDPVRSWTGNHGRAGWFVACVLLAAVLALVNVWIGARAAVRTEEALSAGVASDRDAALAENRQLSADIQELKNAFDSLTAEHERTKSSLEALDFQPTGRDKAMFAAVIDAFPRNGELHLWLDSVFNAKSWKAGHLTLLHDAQQAISDHAMVDDLRLYEPLHGLDTAIGDLLSWMAMNGEGFEEANARKKPNDPTWSYRAFDGEDWRRMGRGGWPEADTARSTGIALAKTILERRDEFERTGRECRL